jgi:hypothetical protein
LIVKNQVGIIANKDFTGCQLLQFLIWTFSVLSLLVVGNRATRYNLLFFNPLLTQIWSVEEIAFHLDFSCADRLWGIRLVQKWPRIPLAPSPLNSFNSLFVLSLCYLC